MKRPVSYDPALRDSLINPEEARTNRRDKRKDRDAKSGVEAQTEVVTQGAEYWSSMLAFSQSENQLSPKEAGIIQACTLLPWKIPSERQFQAALAIADKLERLY